jgi:hypothetical protein
VSRRDFIGGQRHGILLEDVNGSFARLIDNGPKEARKLVQAAVKSTCFALERRMATSAPVGPDSPHLREAVSHKVHGLNGRVGYIEGQGGDDASRADAPTWNGMVMTNAWVALFNEYNPNRQPWMKPSAERESSDFVKRVADAMGQVERNLSGGGGLL